MSANIVREAARAASHPTNPAEHWLCARQRAAAARDEVKRHARNPLYLPAASRELEAATDYERPARPVVDRLAHRAHAGEP